MAKPRLPSEGHVAEGQFTDPGSNRHRPQRHAPGRSSGSLPQWVVQHRLTVAMIHSSVSATDPGPPLWGTNPYIMCPPTRHRPHIDPLKEREQAVRHLDRTPSDDRPYTAPLEEREQAARRPDRTPRMTDPIPTPMPLRPCRGGMGRWVWGEWRSHASPVKATWPRVVY